MDPIAAQAASRGVLPEAHDARVTPGAARGEAFAQPLEPAAPTTAAQRPRDTIEVSPEGLAQAEASASREQDSARRAGGETSAEQAGAEGSAAESDAQQLTDSEQEQVRELQARDREVRAHEQAHKAAGGDLASAPSYELERGPDGNHYAVGGEVGIALSEGDTPQETVAIARRVRSAALAPAQPSSQDRTVAAEAARMESRARAEAIEEEHAQEGDDPTRAPGEVRPGEVSPGEESPAEARGEEHAATSAADPRTRAASAYSQNARIAPAQDAAASSLLELFA